MAIRRELDQVRRDTAVCLHPLFGFRIPPLGLTAPLLADDEELFAVGTEHRRARTELAGCQLKWRALRPAEETQQRMFVAYCPNLGLIVARGLEDEVFAIGSPVAAALRRRSIPSWQQGVKSGPIRGNLPKRLESSLTVDQGQPDGLPIWRPSRPRSYAWQVDELSYFTAIAPGPVEILAVDISELAAVWRPGGIPGAQACQGMGVSPPGLALTKAGLPLPD